MLTFISLWIYVRACEVIFFLRGHWHPKALVFSHQLKPYCVPMHNWWYNLTYEHSFCVMTRWHFHERLKNPSGELCDTGLVVAIFHGSHGNDHGYGINVQVPGLYLHSWEVWSGTQKCLCRHVFQYFFIYFVDFFIGPSWSLRQGFAWQCDNIVMLRQLVNVTHKIKCPSGQIRLET